MMWLFNFLILYGHNCIMNNIVPTEHHSTSQKFGTSSLRVRLLSFMQYVKLLPLLLSACADCSCREWWQLWWTEEGCKDLLVSHVSGPPLSRADSSGTQRAERSECMLNDVLAKIIQLYSHSVIYWPLKLLRLLQCQDFSCMLQVLYVLRLQGAAHGMRAILCSPIYK